VIWASVLVVTAAESAWAQSWSEPARGAQTRKNLMRAIRPIAKWRLGAPVPLVVKDLRVAGEYTPSASEAWWASPVHCAAFGPVLTEWCH